MLASDGSALQWAIEHAQGALWFAVFVLGAMSWMRKRILDWQRLSVGAFAPPPPAVAERLTPAYEPGPPPLPPVRPRVRPPHGAAAGDTTAATSGPAFAEPRDATPAPGRAIVAAFGDPSNARTAFVLAEILAAPVALRSTTQRPWNVS